MAITKLPADGSGTAVEIATAVNAIIDFIEHVTTGNAALAAKVNDGTIGNTALGALVNHVTKGNEALDAKVNDSEIGNTALGALVNDEETGIEAINTKLDEIYDQESFPSESQATEPEELEVPEGTTTVEIDEENFAFAFLVAKFHLTGVDYISQELFDTLQSDENEGYEDAVAVIAALKELGSYAVDGEGSGVLNQITD